MESVTPVKPVDAGHRINLLCDAVKIVLNAGYAHQNLIQRRVRVGFATARVLLSLLEEAGIIGPPRPGQKRREVLVASDDLPAVLATLRGEVSR